MRQLQPVQNRRSGKKSGGSKDRKIEFQEIKIHVFQEIETIFQEIEIHVFQEIKTIFKSL